MQHRGDDSSPFTRRAFIAGSGAAAAVMALPRKASAKPDARNAIYRIHPAIGIARVGNASSSDFFIGPEVPGQAPLGEAPGTVVPPYKTPSGEVKPQAARFRIFEYQWIEGRLTPVGEVDLASPGVVSIVWTVHLANTKASFHVFDGGRGETRKPGPLRNAKVVDRRSLEIDFGRRSIDGPSAGPIAFSPRGEPDFESFPIDQNGKPVIDYLGELRTDERGRLIVIGGKGRAGYAGLTPPPLIHWANNDGWFDDIADGPVTASVIVRDEDGSQRVIDVDASGGAWVITAPPDFAPGIPPPVSGYDMLFDLAVRSLPIPQENALYDDGGPLAIVRHLEADYTPGAALEFPTFVPSFGEHIEPLLMGAFDLYWVNALVNSKHDTLASVQLGNPDPAYAPLRQKVLGYMRPPVGVPTATGQRTMPKLGGDDPNVLTAPDAVRKLALTHVQFGLLRRWANGAFTTGGSAPQDAVITPHGLDRAALERCVGGGFSPGIEFCWELRHPSIFAEPFRLDLNATSSYAGEEGVPIGPGYFTRQMAVPWQADFNDCQNEGAYGWWPTQRPTHALPAVGATTRLDWSRPTQQFAAGNTTSTRADMVACWSKLGFVLEEGSVFVEKERAASIP